MLINSSLIYKSISNTTFINFNMTCEQVFITQLLTFELNEKQVR